MLLLAVPLYCLGVILPVLFLIAGMLLPPLLLTFPRPLAILGVRRQLLAVIIRATSTLTIRLTANPLLGTVSGKQKPNFGSMDNGASRSSRLLRI